MNNKLYRALMGGEWLKTRNSGWIRPSFPLITRKYLADNSRYFVGEKYPYSLWTQNYTTNTEQKETTTT